MSRTISASIGSVAASQKAFVGRPRFYQPGARPLVVFGHGYTGDASFVQTADSAQWETVIDAGFPCVSTDLGGTATFGNATAVTAVTQAITFAATVVTPKAGGVLLFAGSMSTLTMLNYTKANPTNVLAVAIAVPATDLRYLHDTAPSQSQNGVTVAATLPTLAADIETSAGGAASLNNSYYAATSPNDYAPSTLATVPIHLWTSPNDVLAGGTTTTAPFLAATASASQTVLPAQAGLGHSAVGMDMTELVAFLAAHA